MIFDHIFVIESDR